MSTDSLDDLLSRLSLMPDQPPTVIVQQQSYTYPTPTKFIGVRDGFKCEAWLGRMVRYFKGANVPDDARTVVAAGYLDEDASSWWEGEGLPDEASWEEFVTAFRLAFRPAGFLDHVRSLLFTIRMESTVAAYVSLTKRYMNILNESLSTPDARHVFDENVKACFLLGCPLSLRQMLIANDVPRAIKMTMQEVCNLAENFDQVYNFTATNPNTFGAPRATPVTASQHAFAASQTQASVDPMAMEIDNLRIIHELQLQLNALRGGRAPTNYGQGSRPAGRAALSKLSPEERAYLTANRGCFKCRQLGHMQYACKMFPPKSLNNISFVEGTAPAQSGNAPSV